VGGQPEPWRDSHGTPIRKTYARFQVPMGKVILMHEGKTFSELTSNHPRLVLRQRASFEELLQVTILNKLHGDEYRVVVLKPSQ
jgi:hypothetical protein